MSDDVVSGLPSFVLAAWGRQPVRNKGPRRDLSLERIVEAGIRIADTHGLGALSMGRVAEALGASTMALYRHVGGKDELVTLMVDAAFGLPPATNGSPEGWRSALSAWAWESRAAMQAHAWAVRVPIPGPPMTPCQLAWLERGLASLVQTPLAEGHKLSVILLVSGYVRNDVSLSVDLAANFLVSGADEDPVVRYRQALQELTDKAGFPALHAVIAAGVLDRTDHPDDEFVFGLDRVLDGVDVLIRATSRPRRRSKA